jgi:NADPH:quinone reductase-like Zn-dependent oxidoreductase
MRALRVHAYGGPEVMAIEETARPAPGEGEVLVKLRAASINPIDWKIREGFMRSVFAISFPRTLGRDGAGTIAALGPGVQGLKVGDRVLAVPSPTCDGTHAEYAVVPAAQTALVPVGLGDGEAAACGVAGMSAWIPLVEIAKVEAGDRVLVHAAAGGVGTFAVQIAKSAGAQVIGTASAANADYVLSLGADQVIDYRKEDFAARVRDCDIVLDTVGGDTFVRSLAVLKSGGIITPLSAAPVPAHTTRADVRVVPARVSFERLRMEALLGDVARGWVRPQVTTRFPLAEAREAYAVSQQGGVRGKIVLMMGAARSSRPAQP